MMSETKLIHHYTKENKNLIVEGEDAINLTQVYSYKKWKIL